jgi:general stress protein 26
MRALIERAGVAVLMNVDEKGTHVGRPMLSLLVESDPHIYFLTHQNSRKVTQLVVRPQVGVSIISANCVVVVAGSVQLSRDSELIRRLWRPTYRAWFPEYKDDREATVIRVAVDRIDYWEPPSSYQACAGRQSDLDTPIRRHSDEESRWPVIKKWSRTNR